MLYPGGERLSECLGPVTGAVIGQHPCDGDPVSGEEGVRPFPEPGGGFLTLIAEDLGLGQPGTVIYRVVQVRVAGPPVGLGTSLITVSPRFPDHPVSATVRNPPELLDIHVHQVPGRGVFVAPDGCSSGTVQP